MGQKPEPERRLNEACADAAGHAAVIPRAESLGSVRGKLRERDEKPRRKRDERGPRREHESVPCEQQSRKNGREGRRCDETAPQRIEQPPALDIRQRGAFSEDPAGVLPVAAYPAVTAPEIRVGRGREGIGKLKIAHIAAAQIRALERVVRQDSAVGDMPFRADEQRLCVYKPLAGKAAASEKIHAHLAAERAVGLKPASAGEYTRKIRLRDRAQGRAHARMQDAVTGDDEPALPVEHGPVHRVQHRADELDNTARRGLGVAVEREDIRHIAQRLPVARYAAQLAFPAAQEPRKLHERAALSLKAGVSPASRVEPAPAREKIKAAAVSFVEPVHGLRRGGDDRPVVGQRLAVRFAQVGEYAHQEVFAAFAVCKAEALQRGGETGAAVLIGQQRGYDAYRAPLAGHAGCELEPRQPARRNAEQYDVVEQAFRELRQRQQKQDRRRGAAR